MNKERKIIGIVDFKDGQPVKGSFLYNVYNNVPVRWTETVIERVKVNSSISYSEAVLSNGLSQRVQMSPPTYREVKTTKVMEGLAINEDILIKNGYVEDFSKGVWMDIKECDKSTVKAIKNIHDPRGQQYNIEDNKDEFINKVNLYKDYPIVLSKNARRYAKFLGKITWGTEIETIYGYLPENIQNKYGIIVCRDGSLKAPDGTQGSEYTTIPVSGAKGLMSLHHTCNEISKRNTINSLCALHIHIGNVETTRVLIVALYMLCLSIQDEVFSMFAYYKNDEPRYANKEKNYCNRLMKLGISPCKSNCRESFNEWLNWTYKKIFAFLSENNIPDKNFNRKNKKHPKNFKWERKNRYYWVNLMNVFFSERNTIEFRIHTGTMNSQKTINWLFICNAIVQFANTHSGEILNGKKFSLKDVLSYYPNKFGSERAKFLSDYLYAYVSERKRWMKRDLDNNDYLSAWELEKDKDFEFTYGSVTHLI